MSTMSTTGNQVEALIASISKIENDLINTVTTDFTQAANAIAAMCGGAPATTLNAESTATTKVTKTKATKPRKATKAKAKKKTATAAKTIAATEAATKAETAAQSDDTAIELAIAPEATESSVDLQEEAMATA